jgi:hypothetical protein
MTMRPQLASAAASAVLTSGELPIARPTRRAASAEAAPFTSMAMNFSAPSPSRTICCAKSTIRERSASRNPLRRGSPARVTFLCGALPVAHSSTVSLVEVSPSTVIELKETALHSRSSDWSDGVGIAASVKM